MVTDGSVAGHSFSTVDPQAGAILGSRYAGRGQSTPARGLIHHQAAGTKQPAILPTLPGLLCLVVQVVY